MSTGLTKGLILENIIALGGAVFNSDWTSTKASSDIKESKIVFSYFSFLQRQPNQFVYITTNHIRSSHYSEPYSSHTMGTEFVVYHHHHYIHHYQNHHHQHLAATLRTEINLSTVSMQIELLCPWFGLVWLAAAESFAADQKIHEIAM